MTHLEMIANEEARHGNRDALQELQARIDGAVENLRSIIKNDRCLATKLSLTVVVYELENGNG